jgi:hypothetical protein
LQHSWNRCRQCCQQHCLHHCLHHW